MSTSSPIAALLNLASNHSKIVHINKNDDETKRSGAFCHAKRITNLPFRYTQTSRAAAISPLLEDPKEARLLKLKLPGPCRSLANAANMMHCIVAPRVVPGRVMKQKKKTKKEKKTSVSVAAAGINQNDAKESRAVYITRVLFRLEA